MFQKVPVRASALNPLIAVLEPEQRVLGPSFVKDSISGWIFLFPNNGRRHPVIPAPAHFFKRAFRVCRRASPSRCAPKEVVSLKADAHVAPHRGVIGPDTGRPLASMAVRRSRCSTLHPPLPPPQQSSPAGSGRVPTPSRLRPTRILALGRLASPDVLQRQLTSLAINFAWPTNCPDLENDSAKKRRTDANKPQHAFRFSAFPAVRGRAVSPSRRPCSPADIPCSVQKFPCSCCSPALAFRSARFKTHRNNWYFPHIAFLYPHHGKVAFRVNFAVSREFRFSRGVGHLRPSRYSLLQCRPVLVRGRDQALGAGSKIHSPAPAAR